MPVELSRNVASAIDQHRIGSAAVIATIDEKGAPHTAPFGSLCSISPYVLRFGCDRKHDTFQNIRRTGRVSVAIVAPPDVAVSITGKAKVVRERMEVAPNDAVIEISIEHVKDDLPLGALIVSGILYSAPPQVKEFIAKYIDEVRTASS